MVVGTTSTLESAILRSTNLFMPDKTPAGKKVILLCSTSKILRLVKFLTLGGNLVSQLFLIWSS